MKLRRSLLVLAPVALALVACGGDDNDTVTTPSNGSGDSGRTFEVTMVDNDFDPSSIQIEKGETVTFAFKNDGGVRHDAFIGDARAQAEHEEEMSEAAEESDMDMGHGAPDDDALTIEPGETGELTYTFDEAGEIEIGCHEPGHYDSGMKINVNVA